MLAKAAALVRSVSAAVCGEGGFGKPSRYAAAVGSSERA
jgi:hypothetical protein